MNRWKQWSLILWLAVWSQSLWAAPEWVASVRDLARSGKIPDHAIAVAAISVSGRDRAQYFNADTPFSPASTMKVLTTYAALELLGPAHRWHTRLYTDGVQQGDTLRGNLYFVSSGDPKLTHERLWLLMRELRALGIRRIQGELVLDGSFLHLPATWPPFDDDSGDPLAPFLQGPSSVLTNLNTHQLTLRNDAGRIHVHVEPALPALEVTLAVQSAAPSSQCPGRRQLQWQPSPLPDGRVQLTVRGVLPERCVVSRYLSALDPDTYTYGLLRELWRELGGEWQGGNRYGVLPAGARLLATSASPDLVTMVRDINKFSSNPMARMLYLNIGANGRIAGDANDFVSAERVIRDWMRKKGVAVDGLVLDNGSGLSRLERISARQMSQLLVQAWRSPYAAELIASMPLVAIDGTLSRRLRGTPLVGEGHLKTGSLSGVKAITGFLRDTHGETWAVTIFINHRGWVSDQVIDNMLKSLWSTPR